MSSSPYRRIIPREETIGQEIGKHWRIDRPYPSPIFQSEGRDHISFIDRSIYTAHSITDRADYRIHAFRSNWSIVVCTFADCSTPLPASPPLPYFSWTEVVQFHEERKALFYRIIRLQWVMIFISFPSILWMKYYNNYLVHLSNMHHTIWSFLEEQV